jgi:hypothetical protein
VTTRDFARGERPHTVERALQRLAERDHLTNDSDALFSQINQRWSRNR